MVTKVVLKLDASPSKLISLRAAVQNMAKELDKFSVEQQARSTSGQPPLTVRHLTDQMIVMVLAFHGFLFNENPQPHDLVIKVVPEEQYIVRLTWSEGNVDFWTHFDIRKGITQKEIIHNLRIL